MVSGTVALEHAGSVRPFLAVKVDAPSHVTLTSVNVMIILIYKVINGWHERALVAVGNPLGT